MTFGSLFSGIGGLDLGLERAGIRCRWQVEIDPFCRKVLAKHWPEVERYGDIKTIEWGKGHRVDLICGGFPCQPVSLAGRGMAQRDERWLWPEFVRCLRAVRPRFVLVENVPGLLVRGMGDVLGELADLGYDAEWGCVPACAFGAPHSRERVFLFAYADQERRWGWGDRLPSPTRSSHWKATQGKSEWQDVERWLRAFAQDSYGGEFTAPGRERVAHGVPGRVDRIRALGNAVVPQVAEWIGRRIMEVAKESP